MSYFSKKEIFKKSKKLLVDVCRRGANLWNSCSLTDCASSDFKQFNLARVRAYNKHRVVLGKNRTRLQRKSGAGMIIMDTRKHALIIMDTHKNAVMRLFPMQTTDKSPLVVVIARLTKRGILQVMCSPNINLPERVSRLSIFSLGKELDSEASPL